MLTMNYTYPIYPNEAQQAELLEGLEICRGVYNYALRQLRDWIASRKCPIDQCSLETEYIIPMVLHGGLENVVAQGHWGKETACQVGLARVSALDKWRGAGMPNREVRKPALYSLLVNVERMSLWIYGEWVYF